jgi:AcrR family transcriptional regulator
MPSDARLDHLLRTAARVFAQAGYHSTSMRDLAAASGMSLAGMYYYVRGKEELLALVQERCFDRVMDGALAALRDLGDPVERLRAFVRHHVLFFAGHMPEMKVLSHEADSLTGAAANALRSRKKAYSALLADLVGDLLPDPTPRERAVAAYAVFGMMNWIYTWYRPGGPVTPEQLAKQLAELALRSLIGTRYDVEEQRRGKTSRKGVAVR